MRNALPVRLVERIGDLGRDLQRLIEGERALLEAHGERLAVEMGHDQVVSAVHRAHIVDAADVGMIQCGNSACLALEADPRVGIARDLGRKDLDRHGASEPRVARAIDFAHPALADLGGDFVGAEAGASP
jgi:hypothetical protein